MAVLAEADAIVQKGTCEFFKTTSGMQPPDMKLLVFSKMAEPQHAPAVASSWSVDFLCAAGQVHKFSHFSVTRLFSMMLLAWCHQWQYMHEPLT